MQTLFETADALGLNHIQIIVRGLYALAHCDEVHQSERVMIKSFYDACREDAAGLADFKDIVAQELDAEEAAEILNTPTLRRCDFPGHTGGQRKPRRLKKIQVNSPLGWRRCSA